MKKNLCTICANKKYIISEIEETNFQLKRRLLELGFVPGQKVEICKKSILKRVFLVKIRGGLLSIRANLLRFVSVK